MMYAEFAPSSTLKNLVDCYWAASAHNLPADRLQDVLIPDGMMELIFNFGSPYYFEDTVVKGTHILGIRKHAALVAQPKHQQLFSIRFKPGGFACCFGIPASEFSQQAVTVDCWTSDVQKLEEAIYQAVSNQERALACDQFLTNRLHEANYFSRFHSLVSALARDPQVTVRRFANETGFSERTLRRLFLKNVGIGPKLFLKQVRFNRAMKKLIAADQSSSFLDVALHTGYYDQAHFNRDFQCFMGCSPSAFTESNFEIFKVMVSDLGS